MKACLLGVIIVTMIAVAEAGNGGPTSQSVRADRIVVHLKHFENDLHAAFMALELADRLQAMGAKVTLLLDLEGARLGDSGARRASIRGPGNRSFGEVLGDFTGKGGQGLVCEHCASQNGVAKDHVRAGMHLATMDKIAQVVMSADKIVEY